MLKTKNDLFDIVRAGPWQGLVKVSAQEVSEPCHRWQGGKIPLTLWQNITAFFEWSYKATGGEAVVHLYYYENTSQWDALVLPQRGGTGMSIRLLEDHPNRASTFARLRPDWEPLGTVHHHCSASAFQSGTDAKDEETKDGLHVTVGHVGAATYDLHARAVFRKLCTPVLLGDWFESPPEFQWLSDGLQNRVVSEALSRTGFSLGFPEWWKENVIIVQPERSGPAAYAGWHGSEEVRKFKRLEEELAEYVSKFGPDESLRVLQAIENYDSLRELAQIMADHYADLEEIVEAVKELATGNAVVDDKDFLY